MDKIKYICNYKLNTHKKPKPKPRICLVCNYTYYYSASLVLHILTCH